MARKRGPFFMSLWQRLGSFWAARGLVGWFGHFTCRVIVSAAGLPLPLDATG